MHTFQINTLFIYLTSSTCFKPKGASSGIQLYMLVMNRWVKHVEDIKIEKLSINLESAHCISLCCIIILQCMVQKKS